MADAICTVPECNKPLFRREWCAMHYARLLRHGEVGSAEERKRGKKPQPRPPCSVNGCDRPHYGLGLCSMHHQRQWNHGDPSIVLPRGKGESVSYNGWHERLKRAEGKPSQYACPCGERAMDWSYNGGCPDEKLGEHHGRPLVFCLHAEHYTPRCRKCHATHDVLARRKRVRA